MPDTGCTTPYIYAIRAIYAILVPTNGDSFYLELMVWTFKGMDFCASKAMPIDVLGTCTFTVYNTQ